MASEAQAYAMLQMTPDQKTQSTQDGSITVPTFLDHPVPLPAPPDPDIIHLLNQVSPPSSFNGFADL